MDLEKNRQLTLQELQTLYDFVCLAAGEGLSQAAIHLEGLERALEEADSKGFKARAQARLAFIRSTAASGRSS